MQLRFQVGAVEVEILKAPFGSPEPIGLLFERGSEKVRLDEIKWNEVMDLWNTMDKKEEYKLDGFSILWDGMTLTVGDNRQKMTIPWAEADKEQFGMMLFLRSIDPY
jgi:hypothetical protein